MHRLMMLTLALTVPVSAVAQTPTTGWLEPPPLTKQVFLLNRAGSEELRGRLLEVRPEAIVLQTPSGSRTVPLASIETVQRMRTRWTYRLIGAGLGVLGTLNYHQSDCPPTRACPAIGPSPRISAPVAGFLAGWALDAMTKGRKTIYLAERR